MGSFDRHAQVAGEDARLAAMVDMAVGNEDLLYGDAMLLGRLPEQRQIAARIDEGAAIGRRAPEKRAMLRERRDGDQGGFGARSRPGVAVARLRAGRKAGGEGSEEGRVVGKE